MKFVISILALFLFGAIFGTWIHAQDCPNGTCPAVKAAPVRALAANVVQPVREAAILATEHKRLTKAVQRSTSRARAAIQRTRNVFKRVLFHRRH